MIGTVPLGLARSGWVPSVPMAVPTAITLLNPTRTLRANALVVAVNSAKPSPTFVVGADLADGLLAGHLSAALAAARANGRAEEVTKIPTLSHAPVDLIVVVGLGEAKDSTDPAYAETVRRSVGAAIRSLAGLADVAIAIGAPDDAALLGAVAEGAALAAYAFHEYKTGEVTAPVRRVRIRAVANAANRRVVHRAEVIGASVATIRDWVNLTPADLYPGSFADRAVALGKEHGCTAQVLDEKALARGGFGGILGVGQGSNHPPRLVRLTYKPANAKAKIALVGKGITFDTGGYNIKVPMSGSMKHDMAGAATVLAAVVAAARLKLPVEVTATAAMAENKVSSTAILPSDVLTIRGGKTVEIDNTDAEGRLVLADAIVRASEDKPDFLVEASTLTGGALVALGQRTAGVMGSDELRGQVVDAGTFAGESIWPMPLLPELRPGLDSPVADLRNVTGERYGQMLVGGLFLAEFVPAGLEWAHMDIAGPAWNSGGPHGYTPKGGTGYGLRTMLTLLERAAV
ncbi:MAG: putative cytosol aminopeptidase [Pseudonocardiales bacterium]|nr:putative cytosol aminopeptidase [Pseudonocardiales bacterium]